MNNHRHTSTVYRTAAQLLLAGFAMLCVLVVGTSCTQACNSAGGSCCCKPGHAMRASGRMMQHQAMHKAPGCARHASATCTHTCCTLQNASALWDTLPHVASTPGPVAPQQAANFKTAIRLPQPRAPAVLRPPANAVAIPPSSAIFLRHSALRC